MTGIKKALTSFWGSFVLDGKPVQAYGEDALPVEDATFPYIIFKCEYSKEMNGMETAATLWFDATQPDANAKRALLCDEIEKRIGAFGVILPVETGGHLIMTRSTGSFISDYTPEPDGAVIGARVGVVLYNFSMII